jgi:hypothetical protein
VKALSRSQLTSGATALRGTLAWSAVDVAAAVARNQDRLRDRETRARALADLAWDASESAVSGVARVGAGVGLSGYLAAVPAVAGATGATAAAAAAAPLLAGYTASYVVKAVRRRPAG